MLANARFDPTLRNKHVVPDALDVILPNETHVVAIRMWDNELWVRAAHVSDTSHVERNAAICESTNDALDCSKTHPSAGFFRRIPLHNTSILDLLGIDITPTSKSNCNGEPLVRSDFVAASFTASNRSITDISLYHRVQPKHNCDFDATLNEADFHLIPNGIHPSLPLNQNSVFIVNLSSTAFVDPNAPFTPSSLLRSTISNHSPFPHFPLIMEEVDLEAPDWNAYPQLIVASGPLQVQLHTRYQDPIILHDTPRETTESRLFAKVIQKWASSTGNISPQIEWLLNSTPKTYVRNALDQLRDALSDPALKNAEDTDISKSTHDNGQQQSSHNHFVKLGTVTPMFANCDHSENASSPLVYRAIQRATLYSTCDIDVVRLVTYSIVLIGLLIVATARPFKQRDAHRSQR